MKLAQEMTYRETIDDPWGPTAGSPLGGRLCWRVDTARLVGERIDATLVTPGMDWIRRGTGCVDRTRGSRSPATTAR
jgi:hypothetical protein